MDNLINTLLIEDNPGDARLIREMLLGAGTGEFNLAVAGTFQEAIEQVQQVAYDVVLLDLTLPDSIGLDTLLKARAAIPDTAIIVLTGFDDQRVGIQAVQVGAQDYLVKDHVDTRLLTRSIRYAIERHRSEAALRRSEEAYRSLIDDVFDTSMVAVIILDSNFLVVWCNAATEVYFGVGREQLLGRDKRLIVDDTLKCIFADPDDYASRLLAAYEQHQHTDRFECHVLPGENRQERWLEHWSQPIRTGMYAGGRIEHYTDVTDRKLLQMAEQEHLRFEEIMLDTKDILTSTLDLDEVLDRILSNIDVVVPHDTASITLHNDDGLRVARQRRDDFRTTQEITAENRLQLEDIPLLRKSGGTPDAIIIADLQREKQFAEVAIQANVRSYAGVPIRLQNKTIGFINIFEEEADAYSEDDITRLMAFAQHSAIAIQNAQLFRQSRELATLQERQRLARDLHDSVSQTIFTCSTLSEAALRRWEKDPESAHELVSEVHRLTVTALSEMRILLLELRSETLTKVSLKQLFEQYLAPIQSRRGFKLVMDIEDSQPLPPDVQIALYRVTQEALNNIDKHAKATLVRLSVHENSNHLKLTVQDNGIGFDFSQIEPTSLGLGIMRERAQAIGAKLNIESQIGQGTQMTLTWTKQPTEGIDT